jgi:hypothetical protein
MSDYTSGWHDGYKQSREDLVEQLAEKAEQTIDDELVEAIEWLITMLENGEF